MWINLQMHINPSGMLFNNASGLESKTEDLSSLPGLNGVPTPLLHLCKEVGLVGKMWTSLGDQWQVLCKLWLCPETILELSTRSDLSFTQIHKSTIPGDWKDWMNSKLMNSNAKPPADSFRNVFTEYLNGLQLTVKDSTNTVMSAIWYYSGKTGILGLLLCLYWQAEYSGARRDWECNMKCVESIFNTILTSHL